MGDVVPPFPLNRYNCSEISLRIIILDIIFKGFLGLLRNIMLLKWRQNTLQYSIMVCNQTYSYRGTRLDENVCVSIVVLNFLYSWKNKTKIKYCPRTRDLSACDRKQIAFPRPEIEQTSALLLFISTDETHIFEPSRFSAETKQLRPQRYAWTGRELGTWIIRLTLARRGEATCVWG